jgi:CubicO group peptidase (beta-lactamase class C family)
VAAFFICAAMPKRPELRYIGCPNDNTRIFAMLKPFGGVIASTLVLHASVLAAAEAPQSLAERIDAAIASEYRSDGPGATIIVVKDGKTVFRKAYGMADIANKRPLSPDMALRIGSITKQFTATAILMLADEGKLSVDDDITRFLPDYPTHGRRITIEHLLTHTSGIQSYTDKPEYEPDMARDMTVSQLIDTFKNDPLEFEPGARWHYDNSGYALLGAIIEKVSGLSYADFLQQRIFTPLGMTHTAYEGHERSVFPHATGYTSGAGGFQVAPPLSMTQPYAAGAIVSSVDDLARWDAAIASGKLLKAASWQRAFTPYVLSTGKRTEYGYGWGITTLRGRPVIDHDGGINGFRSFALRLPADKIYVAVLENADDGMPGPEGAAMRAAAIAIGKPFPEYKETAVDPKLLDAYSGLYTIDNKRNWTVRHVGDRLTIQEPGGPLVTVSAFSESGFFELGTLHWVEFKRDDAGAVTRVVMHWGEREGSWPRAGAVQ